MYHWSWTCSSPFWLPTLFIVHFNLRLPQLCKLSYLTFAGLHPKLDQDYLMLPYTDLGKADKKKANPKKGVKPREGSAQHSRSQGCCLCQQSPSWLYPQAFFPPLTLVYTARAVAFRLCQSFSGSHTPSISVMIAGMGQIPSLPLSLACILCTCAGGDFFVVCKARILHAIPCKFSSATCNDTGTSLLDVLQSHLPRHFGL